MKKVFGIVLALGLANIVGATPVIIDNFTDTQNLTTTNGGPSPVSSNVLAPGAIGGTRAAGPCNEKQLSSEECAK